MQREVYIKERANGKTPSEEISAVTEQIKNDIVIRPARLADAGKWNELRTALWPDGAADHAAEIARFFAGTIEEPNAVYIGEDSQGEAVAILELSIRTDVTGLEGKRVGYVEGLYVAPAHRHRGIARRLLQTSETWARKEGCEALASDRAGRIVTIRHLW